MWTLPTAFLFFLPYLRCSDLPFIMPHPTVVHGEVIMDGVPSEVTLQVLADALLYESV